MNSQRACEHRAEALRLLGTITVGVAHDMRNVLNAISLQVQLLQRGPGGSDPRTAEPLERVTRQLRVGLALVERVSRFGQPQSSCRMLPLQLDEIAMEAIELARLHVPPERGPRSDVRGGLHAPPTIVGVHAELVSAVLNVVLNAIDATRDGAAVEVRTGAEGNQAWLAVADHGTHESGLGLASVAACISRHGGEVRVETTPGRGTTVAIYLPISRPSALGTS